MSLKLDFHAPAIATAHGNEVADSRVKLSLHTAKAGGILRPILPNL